MFRPNLMVRRSAMAVLSVAAFTAPLLAASADTIHTRSAGYKAMGAAFKTVVDELRGSSPQIAPIQKAARKIRDVSRNQYNWFPEGSGPQPGVKTHAKAEIWSQPVQFRTAQDNFASQAEAFERAAKSGDIDAIRGEMRKLGGACKGCHDNFRTQDD